MYSKIALAISYIVLIIAAFFFYPKWQQKETEATISWDVSGYYMYLPASFIYKDLKQATYKDYVLSTYKPTYDFQQAFLHEKSGNYVMKYAIGQSFAMLPGFAIGHLWASNSDTYKADGFSYPYQISLGISMFLYAILGLFYLRKILLLYFSDIVTAISLLVLVLGTNYINYAAIDQAMTHNVLFTILVFVIWNTIQFYNTNSWKNIFALAFLCGFAALIRPTEIIYTLIPLLWGLDSIAAIKNRFFFLLEQWKKILVFSIIIGLIGSIQLLYWKYATGHWIVYSYQDQGFSWLSPHVKNYTMSYNSGWLRFTPMMFLAFVGIIPMLFQKNKHIPALIFFALAFYIVTAWDVWDYGGTGGRAMVQYYPILLFPIAALIQFMHKNKVTSILLYTVISLFTYLNIWWFYHAHAGEVKVALISKPYYWSRVGKWTESEADRKLLDVAYSYKGIPQNTAIVYSNNFDNDTSTNLVNIDGNTKILLNHELQHSSIYYFDKPNNEQKSMRVFAEFTSQEKEYNLWKQAQFIVTFFEHEEKVESSVLRVFRLLEPNQTKEIYMDVKIPKRTFTKVGISFWNADSDKILYIDNLKVITFDEEK